MGIPECAAPRGVAVLDRSFVPKRADRAVKPTLEDPPHERHQQNERPQNLTHDRIAAVLTQSRAIKQKLT